MRTYLEVFNTFFCQKAGVRTLLEVLRYFFSFSEFVMGLAQFSSRETEDMRLQFIFRIYDMDRDGYISNGELFQVRIP